MILQALVKYYECLLKQDKVSEEGWCQAKVSHAIELDKDGTIKSIIPLKVEETRGKKQVMVPRLMRVPEMLTRSSGIASNFLCDNAKYFLGIDAEETNTRVVDSFKAARGRHLEILQNASGDMAKAVCLFFENWIPEKAKENSAVKEHWEELNEGGNIIFCMRECYAQDDEEIKNLWENLENQSEEDAEAETERICLVTGRKSSIARIHRGIKGVPGAQSSGATLVSFNAPAFESYCKKQSYNAPVGRSAEFAYTTALNYLLSQREYCFALGDSMVVFWAESGEEEYQTTFWSCLNPKADNQKELQKVFENLRRGIEVDLSDIQCNPEQKFHILCLAPNAARLSVRFFYEDSFGNILQNLEKHYSRLEIVKPKRQTDSYMGVYTMLYETVNKNSNDKKPIPSMAEMVLQSVLSDTRYPMSLYSDVIIRIRAEQGDVTPGRAAIIKAFLIKNYNWKEGEEFMGLNEKCEEQSYVLGRLFAVLELIQKKANPGISTTIRDRFFNSACATPASVFPTLIKLKNSHIKKLEREAGGMKVYYENLLMELMGKIEASEQKVGFPQRLTLEEQGKFMLGYYHQIQKQYEKREDK